MSAVDCFSGKTVWITGASSGIGEALAYALSKLGARLVLSARRFEELERVRLVCDNSEYHQVVVLDMMDMDAIRETVGQVLYSVGSIDFLINNAGITQRSLVTETGMDIYRKIMEIDYFAQVELTQAVLPSMLARGSGHIVTVSSIAGLIGVPYRSAYCSAKHAIIGFMDTLRAEVHDKGLRVTVICPGFIRTNIIETARREGTALESVDDSVIENGMSVEEAVERMVKAIADEKPMLVVAEGKEKFGPYLKRLSPGLMYKIVRKAKVT